MKDPEEVTDMARSVKAELFLQPLMSLLTATLKLPTCFWKKAAALG